MGQITKDFAERMLERADAGKHSPLTVWEEKQLAYAWLELRALREWLDSNTTFYDTAESQAPVLASVSKRIWYHATDDQTSYPFSNVASIAKNGHLVTITKENLADIESGVMVGCAGPQP
jgi:hypothetical protein